MNRHREMTTMGVHVVAFVVLLALAVLPREVMAQDVGLPIGEKATPVVLEDLDGNAVDLGEIIGTRPVVVEFWATWCPLCEALGPEFEAAHERFGDRVAFITIAVAVGQTRRAVRRHLDRHPVPGTVLWDTDGRATRAFQAPTTSYVVILDADGRVAYTGVGEDQEIAKALERLTGDPENRAPKTEN